jgi:hypothetical protein
MLYREFRDAGYRFFGLYGMTKDGQCGCGNKDCKAAFKHPLTSNWQHTPEWDDEQVETMELSGQLDTGYGVLIRGLLVIDVDARNGGVASYDRLRNDFPEIEKAGLIVNTGSGGGSQHVYFSMPAVAPAMMQHHPDYPGIDFKGSGFVVGPGSLHASGARYEVAYGSPDDIDAAPSELVALLTKPERHRAELGDGTSMDVSHADLVEMLAHVEPDSDHETWVRCGMAVHHASGGTAFAVWDDWSNKGAKYPGRESLSKRWHSFGKSTNPVTLGTLTHYAEAGGWRASVTFETEIDFPIEPTALTLDITNVNLKRPPGFVGEVAAWIEDQSYRPREHLAVAGALTSIGNIVGLRYTDDLNGVTTNLFTFCVAGSGTGKEPIQQAAAAVMKAARIQQAVHGSIKSEQEIVRNLVDHQAAMFLIDEIGIFLKKVKNAQAKGGASYLDGVIGALMSAYSKANGFMLLTGDMKKEIRKGLKQELMQLEKQENPSPAILSRIGAVRRSMETLDFGLDRPFLSLCGFTTPETFDELVDFYNATNGFIGRSLLFTERDTTPPRKKGFRPRPMPPTLKQALENLYAAGSFDMTGSGRVEYYDERIKIPSTPGAVALMEQASDSFEAMAEDAKSTTGLEALAMRAYEQVAKVSLILSVPGGVRTEEHVLWAYALVRRDIREKMDLVTSNDRAKDSPLVAMRAKIMNLTSGDEGETFGVLVNRMRKYKKADVQKCLDQMVTARLLVIQETKHRYNGSQVKRFKAAQ